jgi:hypothetical protein
MVVGAFGARAESWRDPSACAPRALAHAVSVSPLWTLL